MPVVSAFDVGLIVEAVSWRIEGAEAEAWKSMTRLDRAMATGFLRLLSMEPRTPTCEGTMRLAPCQVADKGRKRRLGKRNWAKELGQGCNFADWPG